MTKEIALEKVQLVKSRRTDDYIQDVLINIEAHINSQESFSYQKMMDFIQSQMSSKLGGNSIYVNKALEFLKNELKKSRKDSLQ